MVFISKRIGFLMAERRRAETEAFKFNSFADEDGSVAAHKVERIPDFVNGLDAPPQIEQTFELAPARCREAEMQHPRPVRRVTLQAALHQLEEIANQPGPPKLQHMQPVGEVATQDALTNLEGMVQVTTSQLAFQNEELFVNDSNQSVLTFDQFVPGNLFEEHVDPFLYMVDNFPPFEGLAYLPPGSLEHVPEHQHDLPLQPSSILDKTTNEVSPAVYNPIPTAAPQVPGNGQVEFTLREEDLWHVYNLIDSSMGAPDYNWMGDWSTMHWYSSGLDMSGMSGIDIADETLQPVAVTDDPQVDGNTESSSDNSPFASPWPVLPQLPPQAMFMNDAKTIQLIPNQPLNPEVGLINAPLQEECIDSSTLLCLPMTEGAPGLAFDI